MSQPPHWPSAAAVLSLSLSLLASACASPMEDNAASAVPDRASFPLVSDAIERRCATLDCHGSPVRNLRLHTGTGFRLDPADVPGSGSTTAAEYEANYRAVLGLEPELIRTVVAEGGASRAPDAGAQGHRPRVPQAGSRAEELLALFPVHDVVARLGHGRGAVSQGR